MAEQTMTTLARVWDGSRAKVSRTVSRFTRRLGERLLFGKVPERLPNDPAHEFVFEYSHYLPKPVAKQMILHMRSPELGWITDGDATILIDALNLKNV